MAVFRKELIDTLRDGRTIFAIFVFPFLLYPAMLMLLSWIESKNDQEAKLLAVRVGIVGEAEIPGLRDWVAAVPGVTPVTLDRAPERLEDADVDAAFVVPAGVEALIARGDSVKVELLYMDADNRSSAAVLRVRPILDDIERSLTVSWARSLGARAEVAPPFSVERRDISSKTDKGRFFAALLIPYLLVFMVAAGAMQTAVDATTGEKERSTLETLLSTAASRGELVMGKTLAVLATSITGAVTGITGLWLTFNVVARMVPGMEEGSLQITIGADKAVLLFLTLLPVAIFLSAVLIAIGCFARSMREGQTYASYVYMGSVFLGLGSFGQQAPEQRLFFIPILNTALLQREILTDTVNTLHAVTAIGVTTAIAALMLVIAVRLFSNESVLFRT